MLFDKKYKRYIPVLVSMLVLDIFDAYSQDIPASIYTEDTTYSRKEVKELRLDFQNLNFFRNNEYKGSLVKGYTLPGMWLLPTVSYQPISSIKIEAGAYMLKYWGQASYPNLHYGNLPSHAGEGEQRGFHALPFFRIRYVPLDGVSLILGNIYGQNNHRLIEPLYNRELAMTSDPEAGVQLLWTNRLLNFDMWINWEDFIFQNDNHQEEFIFGISVRLKANEQIGQTAGSGISSNNVHFYFPLQIIFKHKGGEINTSAENRSVKTWMNAAAGFGMDIKMPFRYFKRMNIEADATYYTQQKGDVFPHDNGYGLFGRMSAYFNEIRLNAGYWQSDDFVSLYGDPLFSTVSVSEGGVVYKKPKMAYISLEYSHKIARGFTLGVHADVYNTFATDIERTVLNDDGTSSVFIDRSQNSISFLAGIYLRTDFSFLIKKFR